MVGMLKRPVPAFAYVFMIISTSTDLFEPGVPNTGLNLRMAPQSGGGDAKCQYVPVSAQAIPAPVSHVDYAVVEACEFI